MENRITNSGAGSAPKYNAGGRKKKEVPNGKGVKSKIPDWVVGDDTEGLKILQKEISASKAFANDHNERARWLADAISLKKN